MRFLRSPVAQFLVIGTLIVFGIVLGSNYAAGEAASNEAVEEAQRTTEVLASAAEPDVTPGLVNGNDGQVDRFQVAAQRLLVGDVQRITIRDTEGLILYDSDLTSLRKTDVLDEIEQGVLEGGGTASRVTGREGEEVVETYAQLPISQLKLTRQNGNVERNRVLTGETVLFEVDYDLDRVEERQQQIFGSFRWISVAPVIVLMLVVTLFLQFLTGQLTRAGKERERLLRSAIDASDAERRRIARDLHDGVVQDLAGTAFSVSAVARDPSTPEATRESLVSASASLRDTLRGLRSLLAEIHPPDLHPDGLAAALADLIAPAAAAGIAASVSVEGTETATDAEAALVWRVAQEAVRNAMRHSGASTLAVTVRGDGGRLALEVVDDGSGFEPERLHDPQRYGLKGLRSLVRDVGGYLDVVSAPGDGTTIRMEVDVK